MGLSTTSCGCCLRKYTMLGFYDSVRLVLDRVSGYKMTVVLFGAGLPVLLHILTDARQRYGSSYCSAQRYADCSRCS
jgi:hypothetical protein